MNPPIGDYALIGDTRTTALVSKSGSIDWLCWPQHDAPALLTRLLDDADGGRLAVAFDDGVAFVGRRYVGASNVVETVFEGPAGRATLVDFMAVRAVEEPDVSGPDVVADGVLGRRLACDRGRVRGRLVAVPTPGYGEGSFEAEVDAASGGTRVRVSTDDGLALILSGSQAIVRTGAAFEIAFDLGPGDVVSLMLSAGDPPSIDDALARTLAYWRGFDARIRYDGDWRDAVVRSTLVLKLLTHSPTGAIVAAPTLGLPEAVPGGRNFDYRYAWVRDASFCVTGFCNVGLAREAADYLRFLRDADGTHGERLRLLYAIDGPMPPVRTLALPGWNGVGPVTIGNAAADQDQYDIEGEFLLALAAYLATFGDPPWAAPGDIVRVVTNVANRALAHRDLPDRGIWELRTASEQLQHTKALIWVALDGAVRIAARRDGFANADVHRWKDGAAALRTEYERECWNAERGAWMRSYGSDVLDAAVLRTVLFGALDPEDPRTASTLAAIDRELVDGDLVYRYRADDGFDGTEATFTACAFWRVGVLALSGRTREARDVFERLLTRGNDVGLYAEQIDAATGEQRGNYPQAFTHMAIINHAVRLDACIAKFGLRP